MLDFNSLNQLFTSCSNLNSTVFWIRNADFSKQIFVSPSMENVYGIKSDTVFKDLNAWTKPIEMNEKDSILKQVMSRREKQYNMEQVIDPIFYRIILPSGENRFIKNIGFPLFNQQKNVIAYAGMSEKVNQTVYEQHTAINKDEPLRRNENQLLDLMHTLCGDLEKNESNPVKTIINSNISALTPKEIACLKLTVKGMTAKEAARALCISPRTVETHLSAIKVKLNCRNKLQLLHAVTGIDLEEF